MVTWTQTRRKPKPPQQHSVAARKQIKPFTKQFKCSKQDRQVLRCGVLDGGGGGDDGREHFDI